MKNSEIQTKALIALICSVQVMIATTLSSDQVIKTYHEISRKPLLYLLGTLMLFLLFFAISLFSRRPLLLSGIVAGLLTVAALINYYELMLHGTVLTLQDIHNTPTAMRALPNYKIQISPTVGGIILSYAALFLALTVVYSKGVTFCTDRSAALVPLVSLVILSYPLFFAPSAPIRSLDWSWEIRYYEDSMPVGVLENISKSFKGITKPDGYDLKEIEGINGIAATADLKPDIIVILNETYYDMDHLIDFQTDVSFMEYYDALDAVKGYATVPMIGGGTNASEYELLTSNSMMLLNTTTPFIELNLENSNSIPAYLKKLGYTTMAAHSEPAGNYHRGDAWKALGFEVTHFQPDFTDLEYYGVRYSASDSTLFSNFRRFYENMPEDQPRFAYLLTIQNHGGWDRNEPNMDTVHIQNTNGLTKYEQQINEYLTCVQQTDDFIGEVVDYFSGVERDVIVYMVGDHGPSLLKEWDLGDSDEINLKKRQVPYFIWNNYGADSVGLPGNRNVDMCALSPMALKLAGLPLSPYYAQILRLSEYTQSLTESIVVGEETGGVSRYIGIDGAVRDFYSGTDEAELVMKYFYMEYNGLQKKETIDSLFDP